MLQYAVFVISGGAGNVQSDPVDQLGKYLILVDLVVHLMPSAGIQPQGHIGELGLTEQLVDGGNALAVVAHRVTVTGVEIDGRSLGMRLAQSLVFT